MALWCVTSYSPLHIHFYFFLTHEPFIIFILSLFLGETLSHSTSESVYIFEPDPEFISVSALSSKCSALTVQDNLPYLIYYQHDEVSQVDRYNPVTQHNRYNI